jgi:GDP-L-fucose synthase
MNILITGGDGYIGKSLYESLKDKYRVMLISRKNFDLTNREATDNFFRHRLFDVVIHCAVKGGNRMKEESWQDMDDNLKMYYNILANKDWYDKLIHFGSGAELNAPETPYGLSKRVIANSIKDQKNFYNLRIYAVFDENELDTRFIKSNVQRYINKEPIRVYQDKYMSFFYMKDLIKVIDYYITNQDLQKELDCCYSNIYTLTSIADIINNLSDYKVEIIKEKDGMGLGYYGSNICRPNIEYLELKEAIKQVYNKLKWKK